MSYKVGLYAIAICGDLLRCWLQVTSDAAKSRQIVYHY